MENKKKIIIIAIAVALVILIGLLTIKLIKISKDKKVININENAIENNTINNEIENETVENTNTVNENEEKNNQSDTQISPSSSGEEEVAETEIEKEETDKEKALNLVKKDWGEDDNSYFTVESIDGNGNYTIYVREGETTREISIYTVNIKTGTLIKE